MDLLFDLRDRHGATLLLITHNPDLSGRCARRIELVDGRILGDD
jgi:putative ABC transport system ATP-binding protein